MTKDLQKTQKAYHWPEDVETVKDNLAAHSETLKHDFIGLLEDEKIDINNHLSDLFHHLYLPFSHWLVQRLDQQQNQRPLIVGINGSQGSGKSTLTKILKLILENAFKKQVFAFSIDDIYKTRSDREALSQTIHPLLKTRGVPGTHDINLVKDLFVYLKNHNEHEFSLPVFDKASDDRFSENQWQQFKGNCEIVLFEGWCVGSPAEDQSSLLAAINPLEEKEDPDGHWRNYVNTALENEYKETFSLIDIQLMLKAPDFDNVYKWRQLQENKLIDKQRSSEQLNEDNKTMHANELKRFIMHFERITRHTLNELPSQADIIFSLGEDHQVEKVHKRKHE